ncbi:ribosomal protein [Lithospermum erythrorhizon]|uniref:Small ribosomal subunit protein uS17c n=1 Tax=Lithospermum erythrorhizon TaxID=34254 RepID=A0AAV3R8Z7_LITER
MSLLSTNFKNFSLTTTTFLHGTTPFPHPTTPSLPSTPTPPSSLPIIRAMRSLQGRVVCATNDKTVAVEVTRLAPHPKYKRRVKKKKKYQAHDPINQFKVGDVVQLEKSKPISKTKAFVAVPLPSRNSNKVEGDVPQELVLSLESQQ